MEIYDLNPCNIYLNYLDKLTDTDFKRLLQLISNKIDLKRPYCYTISNAGSWAYYEHKKKQINLQIEELLQNLGVERDIINYITKTTKKNLRELRSCIKKGERGTIYYIATQI